MWVHFVSYFWVTYGSIVEWRLHSCCVRFGLAKTDITVTFKFGFSVISYIFSYNSIITGRSYCHD